MNFKNSLIISIITILTGCSTSTVPPIVQEVQAAIESNDYNNFLKWRHSDQWTELTSPLNDSQVVLLNWIMQKLFLTQVKEESLEFGNKMIVNTNSEISKKGDYFINHDEFNCDDGTYRQLEFYLYNGKTNTVIVNNTTPTKFSMLFLIRIWIWFTSKRVILEIYTKNIKDNFELNNNQ